MLPIASLVRALNSCMHGVPPRLGLVVKTETRHRARTAVQWRPQFCRTWTSESGGKLVGGWDQSKVAIFPLPAWPVSSPEVYVQISIYITLCLLSWGLEQCVLRQGL